MNFPRLQDLNPTCARLCLEIERFIKDTLQVKIEGKSILVGVSGGSDSIALLFALKIISHRSNIGLMVAHVDHCLREESAHDAEFVQKICDEWEVESFFLTKDVATVAEEKSIGLEQAGREVRYSFFESIVQEKDTDFLALGHTQDDLAEDIFMRLVRGTGWPALGGMSGYDRDRNLIRPLLSTPKKKLQALLEKNRISWREDLSNQDNDYTRNRFRNDIIPIIYKENPALPQACFNLWRLAELDRDYWDETTRNMLEIAPDNIFISKDILDNAHQALRLRLFKSAIDIAGPGQALVDNLFNLDKAWADNKYGAKIQFPGDKVAIVTNSGVSVHPSGTNNKN